MAIGQNETNRESNSEYFIPFNQIILSSMRDFLKCGTEFLIPNIYLIKSTNISNIDLFFSIRVTPHSKDFSRVKVTNDERRRLLHVLNNIYIF
jgi:hypothetical protein